MRWVFGVDCAGAGQAQAVTAFFGVETQSSCVNANQPVHQAPQSRNGSLFKPSNTVRVDLEEAPHDRHWGT